MARVRFAPSPTGHLHLGGVRTALINYLYAKATGGSFVLRIEDTDQTRKVTGAEKLLEENLEWLGMTPDESPLRGGALGPYVQSHRKALYQEHAASLVDSCHAYPCFCSHKRLDLLRKEAVRRRETPKYDGKCRNIPPEEAKDKISKGVPHVVRFKLDKNEDFEDVVYGHIKLDSMQTGDPVIMKADGYPTYHLANVVDDHHMQISHVLRGFEWQISTPKHIHLFRAFGWTPPVYGHLPLLLNQDGSKLSKRQQAITVSNLKGEGTLSNVILNLITQPGGGFKEKTERRIYTLEELVEKFSLEDLHTNSTRVRLDMIGEINRWEMERQIADETSKRGLIQSVRSLVTDTFKSRLICDNDQELLSDQHIEKVLKWSVPRINSLNDLVSSHMEFIWTVPSLDDVKQQKSVPSLEILQVIEHEIKKIPIEEFVESRMGVALKQVCQDREWKFSQVMKLMRSVLSNLKEGPSVAEMLSILGKESSLRRIRLAREALCTS